MGIREELWSAEIGSCIAALCAPETTRFDCAKDDQCSDGIELIVVVCRPLEVVIVAVV